MPVRRLSPPGGRFVPRAVAGGVCTLALVAASGCGLLGDGLDESKLVVYSGRSEDLVQPIIDDFTQASGIEVAVRYGDTAELAAQLVEEGDQTAADVYFAQDAGALGSLSEAGLLSELPQRTLTAVPARFRSSDGTWVGTSGRARVMVYDPSQLSLAAVPDSVFELTDPRWKGKVGIAPTNASFQAFVTAMRVLDGDERARAWLEGMAANEVQTFDNNILVLNAAEDGLISVGLINHYYWYQQVAEEGLAAVPARLKFLDSDDPGALVNVAGAGVLRPTDREADAQRFVEFLLSREAQRFFTEQDKEYPLTGEVPLADGLPPLSRLETPRIDLSDLDSLDETIEMIEEAGLL